MAGKKKDSLEFEESELEKLQKMLAASKSSRARSKDEIVRHSYRIPCAESDKAEAIIEGKSYPVVNIGSRGLGLMLPADHSLHEGDELHAIELRIEGQLIILQGRVVHISKEEDESSLCGVALVNLGEEQSRRIRELIQSRRQALFAGEGKQ